MATTTTLLTLRRLVAKRLGDHYGNPRGSGDTGALTTGGTNNVIDTARPESDKFFKGGYFVATPGSSPQYAYITAYASSTQTFTFSAALGSSLSTSAAYEVYKTYSPKEYADAINEAIQLVANTCRTEQAPDTSLTLAVNTLEYTVPSSFNTVYRVWVEDPTLTDVFWPLSPTDWDILPGSALLRLNPDVPGLMRFPGSSTTTRRIRLEGEANIAASLSAETDPTLAPRQFVVPYAAAWLLDQKAGRSDSNARERDLKIQRLYQEATARRGELSPAIRHANNRRVRQP